VIVIRARRNLFLSCGTAMAPLRSTPMEEIFRVCHEGSMCDVRGTFEGGKRKFLSVTPSLDCAYLEPVNRQ